jgi:hypothetical protein
MLVIFPWWGMAVGTYFFICVFSVIPSVPPLLFPLLPACIIQEDKAVTLQIKKLGN